MEAERLFSKAASIEPNKRSHRFSVAHAQSGSDDYITREKGRSLLKEMSGDSEFTIPALRALVTSHESSGEPQAALRSSDKLVAMPGHDFADELVHLRLLRAVEDERFAPALAAAQEQGARDPKDAGALLVWMSKEGLAREALEWARERAPNVRKMPGIEPGLACCYLALADWRTLLNMTMEGPWQKEFVRHAYRARAFREQRDHSGAQREWGLAKTSAVKDPEALIWLTRTSLEWKWRDEAESTLWLTLDLLPDAKWAIELLKSHYTANGDTGGLWRVARQLVEVNPANEDAQNDLALLSLLLGKDKDKALKISRDLHEKHRDNPSYTSTYAFALHCVNRSLEAQHLLESLPLPQLSQPAYAAYYGMVLAANDSPEKARQFLEIAQRATLLPEERQLVAEAIQASASGVLPAP